MNIFEQTEWSERPAEVTTLPDGRRIITRNVTEVDTEGGGVVYRGESAILTEAAFFAYAGLSSAEVRRENAIIDEYTQELIEGGII